MAANISRHIARDVMDKPKGWKPLVYCWRGGQRSGAMSIILAQIGWMAHKELVGIDPNDPPRLHDRHAVGFDLEAGWAPHHSNIKPERDWFETVIQVAMVAVVSYISAGQLGPAAASAMGLTTTAGGATLTGGRVFSKRVWRGQPAAGGRRST